MTPASRGLALIVAAGCLSTCGHARGGEPKASAPVTRAGAGVAPGSAAVPGSAAAPVTAAAPGTAAPVAADAVPRNQPESQPVQTMSPTECVQLRRRVEQELAAAQSCKATDECIATSFQYAFRPCGTAVRSGAPLDKVTADAKRYQERCNPVIHPVRCANLPRPICERRRCILTAPAAK